MEATPENLPVNIVGAYLDTAGEARVLGILPQSVRRYRVRHHDDYPPRVPCPACGHQSVSLPALLAWRRVHPPVTRDEPAAG